MTPALKQLLDACGVETRTANAKRRLALRCIALKDYIQVHGITSQVFHAAADIAAKARRLLPADQAKRFQKLATLKEDMPAHWNFIDLAAHIEHIVGERV